MTDDDDPEIIFSPLTQAVLVDGHRFNVEIYRASDDPGWVLSVENAYGTVTISDNPPFLSDGLAWRAFEELVHNEGLKPFYNQAEREKLRL